MGWRSAGLAPRGAAELDRVQESTWPWCSCAPGHHLPTAPLWLLPAHFPQPLLFFPFSGSPCAAGRTLGGMLGIGGALEGALHCGGAVRASGHRACWVEWEVGSRCHWCHLEMLVQLPCARCRSREPVLRQGCHSTCSTGPTFLQPKSRCLPVQPLAWGQVGWAGAACSSLRGCASWWILDGKLGMAEFGRVKEGEGRPNPALDSARLLCTSLLSCK